MGLNQYSELLTYLKQLFESDPLVNTVTKGNIDELDLNKMDISPLVHILVTNPNFNNAQAITPAGSPPAYRGPAPVVPP